MSTIDEVKARLNIVETVAGYVPTLKKSGRTYKALCPFHNERTPSFNVDPGRGTWHCFGACSTGGDVIEFVRRIEGFDFKEALRVCAERAGVELRPPSAREREQREQHERLLRANEAAAVFFQSALQGPQGVDALSYAEQRGLDAETRERWQIGLAPPGWRNLADHLTARGFTEADLLEAGLAAEGERGVYDRFRERLIFPTRDVRGRLIGFGARALRPEDEPKYLNTPQTPLFDKSATLYGLDRAGDEARRAGRIVVVEGYMDVIAAHQFGIVNVVASMGTAITDRQMALVKRFTENVVLALDADTAGSEATLRGVQVAADASERTATPTVDWRGLVTYQDVLKADIRVASLPQGEDPDTLVRADPDRFRALIDEAKPVVDHLLDAVTAQIEPDDPRSRARARSKRWRPPSPQSPTRSCRRTTCSGWRASGRSTSAPSSRCSAAAPTVAGGRRRCRRSARPHSRHGARRRRPTGRRSCCICCCTAPSAARSPIASTPTASSSRPTGGCSRRGARSPTWRLTPATSTRRWRSATTTCATTLRSGWTRATWIVATSNEWQCGWRRSCASDARAPGSRQRRWSRRRRWPAHGETAARCSIRPCATCKMVRCRRVQPVRPPSWPASSYR